MMKKKKILIVDDEVFFRASLKDALEDRFEIFEGENGDQAISLAVAHKPDLIILDVDMPGLPGFDACRRLKDLPDTRNIPIVLFMSLSEGDDVLLGLKAGADDFITKPMCLSEIVARVDAHLRTPDFYADLGREDLLFLLELTEKISVVRNPRTILRIIVEKIADVIAVSRCSIVSIDEAGDLIVKASHEFLNNEEIKLDLNKYPEIRKSLESKKTVIVNDVKNDSLMDPVRKHIENIGYNSIVVVPIVKKETVIGTFFLRTASHVENGITDKIFKLCQLVAAIAANALENAILFESMKTTQEHLEDIAIRDGLTKLFNHRHFHTRLEKEFSRAVRYNIPLSLVFFDLNGFKCVNDTYGHTSGDRVLEKIGSLVSKVARESDIPVRYGGDEFALILPNTSARGATEMAARLCSVIQNHKFASLDGGSITVSFGTSTLVDKIPESANQLVELADQAMYAAKEQGKAYLAN